MSQETDCIKEKAKIPKNTFEPSSTKTKAVGTQPRVHYHVTHPGDENAVETLDHNRLALGWEGRWIEESGMKE